MQGAVGLLPLIGLIAISIAFLSGLFFLLLRLFFLDSQRKALNDKILLKSLLEDFGLDVPLELKDIKKALVNPIKKF